MRQAPIIVRVDGVDVHGDGVARHDGRQLVVAGALQGERVEVAIDHTGRRLHGRTLVVIEPHAERRRAPCRHQGTCSGCPLMIATPAGQASLKVTMLRERFGLEVESLVQLPAELGYRWSAKRVVGGRPGAITLGSYMRGSHRVASMHGCLVDHPDIAALAHEIEHAANRLGVEPYDEARRSGDLRYVWLKTDGRGRVLVTLVTAAQQTRARELAQAIRASGVAWSVQPATGNAMRGSDAIVLAGEGTLAIELAGQRVVVGPLGFLQPNPAVAALAYADLVGEQRGRLAYDLYAGAGVTTALLRERYQSVLACESDAEAAAHLGIVPMRVEAFLAERVGDAPEIVVANPPRAGLGPEACALLARIAPPSLGIMSCHPTALARDLSALRGAFEVIAIRAYDTLPQTAHVELVARLTRRGGAAAGA